MPKLISVFLMVLPLTSWGQDHTILLHGNNNLEQWVIQMEDSDKLSILNEIDHWLFTDYYTEIEQNNFYNKLDKFNFIDLDLDDKYEILYEGFIGGEPNGIMIFKQKANGEYIEIFKRFGKIESLWRSTFLGDLKLELIAPPCCATKEYSKEVWSLRNDNFILIEKLNWIEGTYFPESFFNPIKFVVKNDPYKIRKEPKIEERNVLTSFKTGDIGYAIAEKLDETGRLWWFVIMVNNVPPRDNRFYDNAYDDKYFSIGWMSSRYLKRIN